MLARKSFHFLEEWRKSDYRKPLIIRGARQVGKSTLVKQFGQTFKYFISLNLENEMDKAPFENLQSVNDIVAQLFLTNNIPATNEDVLIFIDEIQQSPKAIQMLRYFYEATPHIHIISAGSLLEFTLTEVKSFPVGRVQQMILHPLDFEEYLMAIGNQIALKALQTVPIEAHYIQPLLNLFHEYALIGGMPEVVFRYVQQKNLVELKQIYENLWLSYKNDVEKYGKNKTEINIIRHVIETAPSEKDRITFQGFGSSNYKSREVGEALRSLDAAQIIKLVYPTTMLQMPIIADIKRKPRLQFLDSGLLNWTLGLQADMIGIKDLNDFYRSKIILHLVTQEYIASQNSLLYKPMFWVQENASNNAEVDLVITQGQYVIPVEVKSGEQGRLKSLHQFINKTNHIYGIRLLSNEFKVESAKTPEGKDYWLMNIPYFLASKLNEYAEWFMKNYGRLGKK